MRIKYLGDKADQWKWSQLRLMAEGRLLLYSGMFSDFIEGHKGSSPTDVVAAQTRDYFFDIFEKFLKAKISQSSVLHRRSYEFLKRTEYFEELTSSVLNQNSNNPLCIFLDPNTGIEPNRGCSINHVPLLELIRVLQIVTPEDRVIIYQHQGRVANTETDFCLRKQYLERVLLPKMDLEFEIELVNSPAGVSGYFIVFRCSSED